MSAILVVLGLIVAWSAGRTLAEQRAQVEDETVSLATMAGQYVAESFDGIDALGSSLVLQPSVTAFNERELTPIFAGIMRQQPLLSNIALRDRSGQLRVTAVPAAPGRDSVPMPQYLAEVMAAGKPAVSEIGVGPVSGKPSIGRAYPVRDAEGTVIGVLAFGVNLLQLEKHFSQLPLPEQSVVTMVSREGRILASSAHGGQYDGQRMPVSDLSSGRAILHSDVDGIERFTSTSSVDDGHWLIAVGIPRSLVLQRVAPLWRRNLSITVFGVVSVVVLSLWLATHVADGLGRLRTAAQRIADGDLSPPVAGDARSLEMAELQDAFRTMAANLRETRSALDRQMEQERKTREALQSLQRQVVRQERLAAVGLLVSGVAHELNNPLQGILGTAELLERHPDASPALLEEIEFLKTQSGRAREIIRNLSRFSSPQSGPPTLVDLRNVISEVVQLRRRDLEKSSIALDVETSATRKVFANDTELEQVTLNFVINAQQAIEGAGKPNGRILIRLCDESRKVRLEVQDDGPGVPADDEQKLFQPFFTTKPVGKGTGLGLSVSYGIIDSYGGTIGHRPNEWGGATFFFELPAAAETVELINTDSSLSSS